MKYTCTIEHLAGSKPLERPPRMAVAEGFAAAPIPASGLALPVRDRIVLDAAEGELPWHIALKFLGYLLYREWEPRVEEGVGWHYKPDLVSVDAQGGIRLWIDCGNIAVRKIDRVAAKVGDAPFRILRRTRRDAEQLAASLKGEVRHPERVRIIAFDNGFVDAIGANLTTTNRIRAMRHADALDLHCENRVDTFDLTSRLHLFTVGA